LLFVATDEESPSDVIKRQGCQKLDVVSILSPSDYQLVQLDLAELPQDEKREAARWQIRDLLEFPVEEAVIDVFQVTPFGGDRRPTEFAVAAKRSMLKHYIELAGQAELVPVAIDIAEFALRNIAELFQGDERGTAILYLEEQGGMLTIVREGVQYVTRYLGVGMKDLRAGREDAELLQRQLEAIVLEVQRTFDYCESGFQLPLVSRLLVAQTTQGVTELLSALADLPTHVEELRLSEVMAIPDDIAPIEVSRSLIAIGGALRREHH